MNGIVVVPRFDQKIKLVAFVGAPGWVDETTFDIDRHIVGPPGTVNDIL